MSKTYKFTVPPTREQGSYTGTARASYMETMRQNALADYNSCRAHDGMAPLARMMAWLRLPGCRRGRFTQKLR